MGPVSYKSGTGRRNNLGQSQRVEGTIDKTRQDNQGTIFVFVDGPEKAGLALKLVRTDSPFSL